MSRLEKKIAAIRLIVLDVDGVLTDGTITYLPEGGETKSFCTQDGFGITLAQQVGLRFGAITGRVSAAVDRRIQDLKFEFYKSGHLYKVEGLKAMVKEAGVAPEEVLYMGDDIVDLACAPHVGLFVTPSNAQMRARSGAEWVTEASGGNGAVREMINGVLQVQGKLGEAERHFLEQS